MTEIGVTFEQVLDQALNSRQVADALTRGEGALDREQLRTIGRQERSAITAAAAAEYQAYLQARSSATANSGGSGLATLLSVLVPALSAVAAAAFLLTGYGLRVFVGRPYIGDGLITAGLLCGAVAGGAAVGDLVWLLATASRKRSVGQGDASGHPDPEVTEARRAWELALLERGMMPFLLGRLDDAPMTQPGDRAAR